MSRTPTGRDEIATLGREIYESRLRAVLEPGQNGRFVAIEIISGDYAVADSVLDAVGGLRSRHPGVLPYIHRIGHTAAFRMGGRFRLRPTR